MGKSNIQMMTKISQAIKNAYCMILFVWSLKQIKGIHSDRNQVRIFLEYPWKGAINGAWSFLLEMEMLYTVIWVLFTSFCVCVCVNLSSFYIMISALHLHVYTHAYTYIYRYYIFMCINIYIIYMIVDIYICIYIIISCQSLSLIRIILPISWG